MAKTPKIDAPAPPDVLEPAGAAPLPAEAPRPVVAEREPGTVLKPVTADDLAEIAFGIIKTMRPPGHVMDWRDTPQVVRIEYRSMAVAVANRLGLDPCRDCGSYRPGDCGANGCPRWRPSEVR
jgi:hypothetical protein